MPYDTDPPNWTDAPEREGGAADPKPKQKKPTLNALTLVKFIEDHQGWRGALRVNQFTQTLEVSGQFPPTGEPITEYRAFREPGDLLEAMLWLQGEGFAKAGKGLAWDTIAAVAHRNAYHPVKDYLDSLEWDETPRLPSLFKDYFRADTHGDDERTVAYLAQAGQCFMVSAVARVREPGCKVDHLPVLVGNQGYGKSSAIRSLCPDPAWFSDDLSPDLTEKDTKDSLTGKWLVELAEFPHVRREVERVKAFFSRQTDRFRRAYDRLTGDWPRQCVFAGTTNDLEFIDATGNRRYWPIEVTGVINTARIENDRDQLWAEAVHLYEHGFQWWLIPDLEKIAAEQQDQFVEQDLWSSLMDTWITEWRQGAGHDPFTLADAMAGALLLPDPKVISKPEQMRAAACLKALGYRRRKVRSGTLTEWKWFPRA